MADIYVHNGGSNTSPYDTWAKAATTLSTGLSVATNADTIWIASDHAETAGAAITLTLPTTPGLRIISSDRTSGEPPTTLATGAAVSVGAANTALTINNSAYVYGVTFNGATNNASTATITLHNSSANGCSQWYDSCQFHILSANTNATLNVGTLSTTTDDLMFRFVNCTNRVSNAAQAARLVVGEIEYTNLSLTGTAPTNLFSFAGVGGAILTVQASDLTGVAWSNFATSTLHPHRATIIQCKLPSGVTFLSTTSANDGGGSVTVVDSQNGDAHMTFGHYTPIGSIVSDSATLITAGAAGQSWRITTSSSASRVMPFRTPWINFYNTGTSAITPYLEVLRNNGTASAYTDAQVWAEFSAKVTSGSTAASYYTDSAALTASGTAQAAGVGTGSWTIGSSNSPASFKCDSGSSLTPAENGHIRARLCVAVPSISGTLYLDPQIRT